MPANRMNRDEFYTASRVTGAGRAMAGADRAAGARPPGRRDRPAAGPDRDRDRADERQVPPPKAIKALSRLRDAYQRAGDEAAFIAYLDELRQRQPSQDVVAKLDAAFAQAADRADLSLLEGVVIGLLEMRPGYA
jgi:hypothetical protein